MRCRLCETPAIRMFRFLPYVYSRDGLRRWEIPDTVLPPKDRPLIPLCSGCIRRLEADPRHEVDRIKSELQFSRETGEERR